MLSTGPKQKPSSVWTGSAPKVTYLCPAFQQSWDCCPCGHYQLAIRTSQPGMKCFRSDCKITGLPESSWCPEVAQIIAGNAQVIA